MLTTFFLGVNIPIIHCLKSRVEVVCRSMQFRESTREYMTHSLTAVSETGRERTV